MTSTYVSPSHRPGGCCFRVLLLLLAVLCAIGSAWTWPLVKRNYTVTAMIQFDPVVPDIGTAKAEKRMSGFTDFLARQAEMVISPKVVERVANDLAGEGLQFVARRSDTSDTKTGLGRNENDAIPHLKSVLRKALLDETITARPARRGEVIIVDMHWDDAEEAKKIVDSFVSNYSASVTGAASDGEKRPGRQCI